MDFAWVDPTIALQSLIEKNTAFVMLNVSIVIQENVVRM